jgi:hypothetical protein
VVIAFIILIVVGRGVGRTGRWDRKNGERGRKNGEVGVEGLSTPTSFVSDSQPSLASFNFPVSSLPILASCSSNFDEMIEATITRANTVYREFLNSETGAGFNGEVSLHDLLCSVLERVFFLRC